MPTLKTEILNSVIEISFQEKEKEKLLKVINNFNERINDFKEFETKISNSKIFYLAALKAEDQIEEFKSILKLKEKELSNLNDQKNKLNSLIKEIIFLKDEIEKLNSKNLMLENINSKAINEMINMQDKLDKINKMILYKKND